MGKYLFVMPWGSMELDIEEDAQGLHVVMTSPERNMTVVPEVAERRGDVIVLEAGAGDYGMHFELRGNGNGYDVTGKIPVVGEISGKAAPAEQVAAAEKKRKEEMEQVSCERAGEGAGKTERRGDRRSGRGTSVKDDAGGENRADDPVRRSGYQRHRK